MRVAWVLEVLAAAASRRAIAVFGVICVLLAPPRFARAEEAAAALARVRSDPALASNGPAIDDLVRAADASAPSAVEVEALALAAEAYASRLGRAADAAPLWERIVVHPNADPVTVRSSARLLAFHYLSRGEATRALAAARHGDERLASDVRRALRRRSLRAASLALLGVVLLLAAIAVGRAGPGRWSALAKRVRGSLALVLVFALYVGAVGALLASRYERGSGRPFLLFALGLAPLLVVARAWGAAGSRSTLARGARSVLCAASALGMAFLVLEGLDVAYLESLGL